MKSSFLMLNDMVANSMPNFLSDKSCKSELPKATDVLVIGAGLLGSALAYYLSKSNLEVVLVERGELNREASGTNAGSFHFQIALHQLTSSNSPEEKKRLLNEVKLQLEASQLWHQLEGELNRDLGVHFTGGIMVAETAEELQILRDKQEIEEKAGLETQVLTGAEMCNFAPYLAPDLAGIAFCAAEGHANPLVVGPTYAYKAHEMGASVRTGCEVLEVEVHSLGHPFRFTVKTNRGSIRCNRIVNASGAWATDLSMTLGIKLPMGLSGLHVNVTEPRERILKPMVQHIGRRLTL
jgi:glycine/D-amino acid oxidase-like deaminating enzyme